MILTNREKEYLKLLCLPEQQISDILCVSKFTTKNMIHKILNKMKVTNRQSAIALAIQQGIVHPFDVFIHKKDQ